MAKQRLSQFRKLEVEKQVQEMKLNQQEDLELLENEQLGAIDEFNNKYDQQFSDIVSEWEKNEKEMEEAHERKLEDELTQWEHSYPKQTKYSASLLNDQKILNGLIKQEK